MRPEFKRTQVGFSFFVQLLVVGAIAGPVVYYLSDGSLYLLGSVAGVMLLFAFLFNTLTITVSGGRVGYSFGPGIIRGSYQISDVMSAEVVTNPWYYFFGVRGIPKGWMFNVSGFHAVEITLKDGTKIRLGTDRPEELKAAIQKER
jgi:hypothetical protein